MSYAFSVFALVAMLQYAAAAVRPPTIITAYTTIHCSTAWGPSKVPSPIPRTTFANTTHMHTTLYSATITPTVVYTPSPSTVTSTSVNVVTVTTSADRSTAITVSTVTGTTTTTDTSISTVVTTTTVTVTAGSVTYTSTAPSTSTTTVTYECTSPSMANIARTNSLFPTQAQCTKIVTLLTQTWLVTTATAVTTTAAVSTATVWTSSNSLTTLIVTPPATTVSSQISVRATTSTSTTTTSTIVTATTSTITPITTVTTTPVYTLSLASTQSVYVNEYCGSYPYYSGAGFTENLTNPGNSAPNIFPPIITSLNGTLSACDAIQECANLTYNDPLNYYSFDLHYLESMQQWTCVQFYDDNTDPSYFDVVNADVIQVYGYHTGC